MIVGDELLGRWLREYCALGIHRVGTAVDRATNDWFAARLGELGAVVERRRFGFDRYVASTTVTIDGVEVPSEPLYYEAVGTATSIAPRVAVLPALFGHGSSPELDDEIAAARANGASVLVVATDNPLGELQMPNRAPRVASGFPVVLVAGRHASALRAGAVDVDFVADVAAATSDNIVATFGPPSSDAIVLATPLSGWFTCAAERGTGIAVLLALAARLAPRHPVVAIGAPAHELLPHVGLASLLQHFDLDPRLVVHLGANVAMCAPADGGGPPVLAPDWSDPRAAMHGGRAVFARMDEQRFAVVAAALGVLGLAPVLDPPRWFGEGEMWAEATSGPLLSFVGTGPRFHTPADVVDITTDDAALALVTRAIGDAVEALLAMGEA